MDSIKEANDALYLYKYLIHDRDKYLKVWNKIKSSDSILRSACEIVNNKFGEEDLQYKSICEAILIDSGSISDDIYQELINNIFSNKRVARTVLSNDYNSFLLLSLMNFDLKLSSEQKKFAVSEAMNVYGTTKVALEHEKKLNELSSNGISNDKTVFIENSGEINPIGELDAYSYLDTTLTLLSPSQVHGNGSFDIRYWILRNPNWGLEEKKNLIYEFYADQDEYLLCIEDWQWDIVNDVRNYKNRNFPPFDVYTLFNVWTYDMLLNFHKDKEVTDELWEEICFCKQMMELRPPQEDIKEKKLS